MRSRRALVGGITSAVLAAALLGACAGGDGEDAADADVKVPVALVLETDSTAFDRAAAAAADPAPPPEFLTLGDIASRYGASRKVVETATTQLRELGVDVVADPTRSVLWGTVQVSDAEELFDVGFDTQPIDGGSQSIRATGNPAVPDGVDGVRAVVGLSATVPADGGGTTTTTTASTEPPPCPGGQMDRAGLAQRYGVDQAVTQGSDGSGVTVAMIELQAFDPAVFQTYDVCTPGALDADRVSQRTVPPSPPPVPGSEVALDTVAVGLLAPGADQQLTQFDPESSIVFPLLSILDAAGRDGTPQVLLSTVGFCEESRSRAEIELGERLLAAFAMTGTTSVASSGDLGSTSCHPGTDDPAVQYPASSAWVTSIGGASFQGAAAAPSALTVWNSTPATDNAGGGGSSTKVARPEWQTGTNVDGDRRAVPDVAAFATPEGAGLVPTCTDGVCSWQNLGGTSLSGAAVAGSLALLLQGDAGGEARRVGLLSPLLAAAAGQVATDVTVGDNQVFSQQCCTAGAGYDLASGWGLVDLPALVALAGARSG